MNWITRLIERPKAILRPDKEGAPEGLWQKCPGCSEMLYAKELERSMKVCPRCDQHMRLSAAERARYLFDENSLQLCDEEIRSLDPLNFKDKKRYKDRLKEFGKRVGEFDALRNYIGNIEGVQISASIFEFSFMGGSMGSLVGEKIARGMEHALERGCPYLIVTASGGARMQEGILSLMQMAKTSAMAAKLHEAGIPFICLLADPTMGGVSASIAWLGDVIIAEPKALIGFAGPRVIQETVGEKLPEGFQRSEFLLEHGLIDAIVDRREQRAYLKTLLDHLGQRPYPQAA
ncbi:MAG: acetyl-CoA carboxylase, carboxyltransferase subunit beta [Mariprofundaceae bacterium]